MKYKRRRSKEESDKLRTEILELRKKGQPVDAIAFKLNLKKSDVYGLIAKTRLIKRESLYPGLMELVTILARMHPDERARAVDAIKTLADLPIRGNV